MFGSLKIFYNFVTQSTLIYLKTEYDTSTFIVY